MQCHWPLLLSDSKPRKSLPQSVVSRMNDAYKQLESRAFDKSSMTTFTQPQINTNIARSGDIMLESWHLLNQR